MTQFVSETIETNADISNLQNDTICAFIVSMKRYFVPAIEALGRDAIEREMERRGYGNADRALTSWIQRRKVPEAAKLMMLEIAHDRKIAISLDDFGVVKRTKAAEGEGAAA